MADFNAEMLDHYQRELSYLRHSGAAFAQRYPKVANRLQLSGDESPDPHVERLLESFAFLTARLQQNVENDFPEITTALLGVLFPQFTTPIPAMTVDKYDFLDDAPDIATVLRLRVETLGDPLSDLEMTSLRFYLNGVPTTTSDIYELLFAHLKRVAILVDDEKRPRYLPESVVRPVGLEQDEAVMPYPDQGHPGYRLLMEYFSYPEKFHFFDVDGLDTSKVSKHFDILFLLDQPKPRRLSLAEDTFQLGCAAMVEADRICSARHQSRSASTIAAPNTVCRLTCAAKTPLKSILSNGFRHRLTRVRNWRSWRRILPMITIWKAPGRSPSGSLGDAIPAGKISGARKCMSPSWIWIWIRQSHPVRRSLRIRFAPTGCWPNRCRRVRNCISKRRCPSNISNACMRQRHHVTLRWGAIPTGG